MITIAELNADEILNLIPDSSFEKVKFEYLNYKIKLSSARLRCFKANPCCVCCGIKGNVFLLQSHTGEQPHINFYSKTADDLVLMTKDHIIPIACGGNDYQSNFQTMCTFCNSLKGGIFITNEDLKELKDYYFQLSNCSKATRNNLLSKKRQTMIKEKI